MFYHQLRNELWKLFGKKRTYIGFAMFLLAQNLVTLLFRFTRASQNMVRTLEGNGYAAQDYLSSLTIATIILVPIAYVLLPLYASLVGGDLVAKEAEDGTLRMILSRPISRVRLLLLKWLSGVIFSLVLVMALGLLGILFASIWFPWGGLFAYIPGELFHVFNAGSGLRHYLAADFMMWTNALSVMGLAFMFSCFNVKPAAATILAISLVLISYILQQMQFFQEYRHWFLSYHLNIWQLLFAKQIPWWKVGQSLSILFGFNVTFLAVGCMAFHVRDIKS
jgi:ABC-2 type transport system permease protein